MTEKNNTNSKNVDEQPKGKNVHEGMSRRAFGCAVAGGALTAVAGSLHRVVTASKEKERLDFIEKTAIQAQNASFENARAIQDNAEAIQENANSANPAVTDQSHEGHDHDQDNHDWKARAELEYKVTRIGPPPTFD